MTPVPLKKSISPLTEFQLPRIRFQAVELYYHLSKKYTTKHTNYFFSS
jgi:hypothetical protein